MSLEIQINNHEDGHIYHPNDTINGTLHLKGPLQASSLAVVVALRGYYYTRVDVFAGDSYRDWATLFLSPVVVYNGPVNLLAGLSMVFNFSLKFPETTEECKKDAYSKRWPWTNVKHYLPPTCRKRTFSHTGLVKYHVAAAGAILDGDGKRSLIDATDRDVISRGSSAVATPDHIIKIMEQPLQNRGIWKCSSTSGLWDILGPRELLPGLVLKAHISTSAKLDTVHPIHLELVQAENQGEDLGPCKRFYNASLNFGQTVDISRELGVVVRSAEQTESFSSWAVTRIYEATLVVCLKVGGRKQRIEFKVPELTISPATREVIAENVFDEKAEGTTLA